MASRCKHCGRFTCCGPTECSSKKLGSDETYHQCGIVLGRTFDESRVLERVRQAYADSAAAR